MGASEYADHPLAAIFPLLADDDMRALADDIAANGQQDPVWLYAGQILDGRNRYRACRLAGVPCRTQEYTGTDPLGFVISKNLHRRHLTESQRAMVAAKIATAKDGRPAETGVNLPQLTNSQAAGKLNISPETVKHAKTVQTHGVPELVQAVEKGDVSVSAAAEVAKLPADQQKKAVQTGTVPETAKAAKAARANGRVGTQPATTVTPPAPAEDEEDDEFANIPTVVSRYVTESDEDYGMPASRSTVESLAQLEREAAGNGEYEDAEQYRAEREELEGFLRETDGTPVNRVPAAPPADAKKDAPAVTLDAWGIPVQPHAAEAFAHAYRFDDLLSDLADCAAALSVLVDSPAGGHLLKCVQWVESRGTKAAGRWVLSHLDNAIATIRRMKPTVTDCPYAHNPDGTHPENCSVCHNLRWTGTMKGHQIPPALAAAMRTHYGVTEGA